MFLDHPSTIHLFTVLILSLSAFFWPISDFPGTRLGIWIAVYLSANHQRLWKYVSDDISFLYASSTLTLPTRYTYLWTLFLQNAPYWRCNVCHSGPLFLQLQVEIIVICFDQLKSLLQHQ